MLFLGIDLGSSSVKVSVLNGETNTEVVSAFAPEEEMKINAPQDGWAEQDPELWISYIKECLVKIGQSVDIKDISAIGISYQMHGLVCVDADHKVLRPAIIWCDSRAVETGNAFLPDVGADQCMDKCLNLPANFTVSKLKWVEQNEPDIYKKIHKIMLPGDYVAMRLSGEISTSISGLSEGIAWDFKNHKPAYFLFDAWKLDLSFIPEAHESFGNSTSVSEAGATEFGLKKGTAISYRAGDQPNNALSLGAVNTGDFVATAGTSGVVYGVVDSCKYDTKSRVNVFAHVNHSDIQNRLGILMCINGCAILNNWARQNWGYEGLSYSDMNKLAEQAPEGSSGVMILPMGNGAERIYNNKEINASVHGLKFNVHNRTHLFRAVQEGIAFTFKNGFELIEQFSSVKPAVIKAGNANLFLSNVFAQTITNLLQIPVELYDTNGALGAARGAAVGNGFFKSFDEAFQNLTKTKVYLPEENTNIKDAYEKWKKVLSVGL